MSDALGFRIETPTVTEPWRKVLLDAADYIEAHGWCQNRLRSSDGRVCIMGALIAVNGQDVGPNRKTPGNLAYQALFRDLHGEPASFNDRIATSAAEVCAALRSCAVQP